MYIGFMLRNFMTSWNLSIYVLVNFSNKKANINEKNSKYLKNDKNFWGEIKNISSIFKGPFYWPNKTKTPWSSWHNLLIWKNVKSIFRSIYRLRNL